MTIDDTTLDKDAERMVMKLSLCSAPEIFGLIKLMGISIADGDKPRETADIIGDIIIRYTQYNRKQKRNFMKLLKTTTKGRTKAPQVDLSAMKNTLKAGSQKNSETTGEVVNGTTTEDSQTE